jgi:hypothetical protein
LPGLFYSGAQTPADVRGKSPSAAAGAKIWPAKYPWLAIN